jgi:ligand-binding sensor domain-containing protein/two-component sensor histidine kinase
LPHTPPCSRAGLRLVLCLLALAACGGIRAYTLPVRLFTIGDGLPRNYANCLTPGQNGVMWICTNEGLARFDGYQIRVFGPAQGLPSRGIYDMAPARGGGYWLVTEAGVCRLPAQARIGDPCKVWPGAESLRFRASRVHEAADGRTWLMTSNEVVPVDVAHQRIDSAPRFTLGIQLNAIADGPAGELLVGANSGLYRWNPGQATTSVAPQALKAGVSNILPLGSGIYWLAADAGLILVRFEGPGRQTVYEQNLLPAITTPVGVVYRGPTGRIWVPSVHTLFQLEAAADGSARVVEALTRAEGLPKTLASRVAEDGQGALWAAAGGTGVFRMYDSGIRSYFGADGLGSARIASIFEDRSGRVCVMTSWDGTDLRAFDGNRFQTVAIPYPPDAGHSWGWHQIGLQARSGEWWFPSGRGLLRLSPSTVDALPRNRRVAFYDKETGMPHPEIFRVFEDSAGDLWVAAVGSDPTLARRDQRTGRFIPYQVGDAGVLPPLIYVIQESHHGDIWLGTDHGLYRLRGDRFVAVVEGGGQPRMVPDIVFDQQGRLWAATSLYGVLRVDHPEQASPSYVTYTVAEGLSANSIKALAEAADGFIYAATAAGVDRIDPRAGPSEHRVRRISMADGLPSAEATDAFRDSHGRIWIGTENGLASFDPARLLQSARPEPFITSIRVRGVDQPLAWDGSRHVELELRPDRNQVEIGYAGSGASQSARFQYRLNDEPWSEQSGQLVANYPVLPYGQSRFEVRIINADGDMGANVASVDLNVLAPVWRRAWFLAIVACALIVIGTLIHRARVDRLLAIANLRTHIATDLHDDIGANLTQIAILSEVAQRNGTASNLKEISAIARDTVAQMSDIVWAISPSHDGFDSLVHRLRRFSEDTLGGAGIEVTFDVSGLESGGAAPLEVRRPLFLIFKEAIHNVVRHSHATRAWICFEVVHGQAKVTVDDDGQGFDVARVESPGEGIASIKRRATQLGGSAAWTSRPGGGTRLTVSIPLARRTVIKGEGLA